MCNKCDELKKRISINRPSELWNIVNQIKRFVENGTLKKDKGNIYLLKEDQPLDDIITFIFKCTNCKQKFKLFVETYHGYGGYWELMRPRNGDGG